MRKYLIAMGWFVGVWGPMAAMGITGPLAPIVLVLGVLAGGIAYLGPRAIATGFGGHIGEQAMRGRLKPGEDWKPPPLENHRATFVSPKDMLVHAYDGLWLAHPLPFTHLDIISCPLCKQEGVKRWPEGAVHPTIEPGELVTKKQPRPFWPRP